MSTFVIIAVVIIIVTAWNLFQTKIEKEERSGNKRYSRSSSCVSQSSSLLRSEYALLVSGLFHVEHFRIVDENRNTITYENNDGDKLKLSQSFPNIEITFMNNKCDEVWKYPFTVNSNIILDDISKKIRTIKINQNKVGTYKEKWQIVERRPFTDDEKNAVERTNVVATKYGHSIHFFMKGGGQTYLPISSECHVHVGQSVDLDTAQIVVLSKGAETIYRVEVLDEM